MLDIGECYIASLKWFHRLVSMSLPLLTGTIASSEKALSMSRPGLTERSINEYWFAWTLRYFNVARGPTVKNICEVGTNLRTSGKLWRLTVSWKVKVGKCIRSSTQVVFVREFVLKVLTLDIPPQFTWMRIRRLVPFRIGFCNAAMMQVSIRRSTSPDLAARH